MDSKDVEEIFKGVLTDESQESQESSVFPIQPPATPHTSTPSTPLVSPSPHPGKQKLVLIVLSPKTTYFLEYKVIIFIKT